MSQGSPELLWQRSFSLLPFWSYECLSQLSPHTAAADRKVFWCVEPRASHNLSMYLQGSFHSCGSTAKYFLIETFCIHLTTLSNWGKVKNAAIFVLQLLKLQWEIRSLLWEVLLVSLNFYQPYKPFCLNWKLDKSVPWFNQLQHKEHVSLETKTLIWV